MADSLTKIVRPNAVELARETIRGAIANGQYGPGEFLPSERSLSEMLGISRSSLRIALLELRDQGYLASELGMAGGNRVTDLATPVSAARGLVRTMPQRFTELMEYRVAIECETARLAAKRATAKQIEILRQSLAAIAESRDAAAFRKADNLFHVTIAEASGNARLAQAVLETRSALALLIGDIAEVILETTFRAHQAVADAIHNRDSNAAERAMRAHLEYSAQELIGDCSTGAIMRDEHNSPPAA